MFFSLKLNTYPPAQRDLATSGLRFCLFVLCSSFFLALPFLCPCSACCSPNSMPGYCQDCCFGCATPPAPIVCTNNCPGPWNCKGSTPTPAFPVCQSCPVLAQSYIPTVCPIPTPPPTPKPTVKPTTRSPSRVPSKQPSLIPSRLPTNSPSQKPSNVPSLIPSSIPSAAPSRLPSKVPSIEPTVMRVLPSCIHDDLANSAPENISVLLRIGRNSGRARMTARNNGCLSMLGDSTLHVENNGALRLWNSSAFAGYGAGKALVYGNVTVADNSYFGYFGSNPGKVSVYGGGIFFVMDEGTLYRVGMTVDGGILESAGGYIEDGSIKFAHNGTYRIILGKSPLKLLSSNVTFDNNTILDVVGNISALTGSVIFGTASGVGRFVGEGGILFLNGKPANNTYTVVYAPSPSQATSVSLVFPTSSNRRLLETESSQELASHAEEAIKSSFNPSHQTTLLESSEDLSDTDAHFNNGRKLLGFEEVSGGEDQAYQNIPLQTSGTTSASSSAWFNWGSEFYRNLGDGFVAGQSTNSGYGYETSPMFLEDQMPQGSSSFQEPMLNSSSARPAHNSSAFPGFSQGTAAAPWQSSGLPPAPLLDQLMLAKVVGHIVKGAAQWVSEKLWGISTSKAPKSFRKPRFTDLGDIEEMKEAHLPDFESISFKLGTMGNKTDACGSRILEEQL